MTYSKKKKKLFGTMITRNVHRKIYIPFTYRLVRDWTHWRRPGYI